MGRISCSFALSVPLQCVLKEICSTACRLLACKDTQHIIGFFSPGKQFILLNFYLLSQILFLAQVLFLRLSTIDILGG